MASALFRLQLISRTNDRYTRTGTVNVAPIRSSHASNSVQLCECYRPNHADLEWQFDIWIHAQAGPCLWLNQDHATLLCPSIWMPSYSPGPIAQPDAVSPIQWWTDSDALSKMNTFHYFNIKISDFSSKLSNAYAKIRKNVSSKRTLNEKCN